MAGTTPAGNAPTQAQTSQVQDQQTANDLAAYAAIEAAADTRAVASANHELAMSGYKQMSEAAQGMPD